MRLLLLLIISSLVVGFIPPGMAVQIDAANKTPFGLASTTSTNPFDRPPDYDSGWTDIASNATIKFEHNLGGDEADYLVDVQAYNDVQGEHQYLYGVDYSYHTDHLEFHGFYWYALDNASIKVKRAFNDLAASRVRVRIWVAPSSDYDSGWYGFNQGNTHTFIHNLLGNPDDYFVDLKFRQNGSLYINNIVYGMDYYYENGVNYTEQGAAWLNLTEKSIDVMRGLDDTNADAVQVRIWRLPSADFDTGWQSISPGGAKSYYHNLGGPWNDYKVDIQFKHDGQLGTHQIYYGGETTYINNVRSDVGAYISHLNNHRVTIRRETEDPFANKVRVRLWSNPTPKYDSGWQSISRDVSKTLSHNVGGNPDHYVVDMHIRDEGPAALRGVNQWRFGGDDFLDGTLWNFGVYWWGLTDKQIKIRRKPSNFIASQARVRIWIAPVPSYDSGWSTVFPDGLGQDFIHQVGGSSDLYVVDTQFKDISASGIGVNQKDYGGNYYHQDEFSQMWSGASWHNLDNNSVSVTRGTGDTAADQVRVRMWRNDKPEYDSNWKTLDPGKTKSFPHNLGGDSDDYVLDLQFFDLNFVGTHQLYWGGNTTVKHDGTYVEEGAYWHNLNKTNVKVTREADDWNAKKVRVRIWKPGSLPSKFIYLPAVLHEK